MGQLTFAITRNCNHFTADLCHRLTGKTVPGWINRAAKLGTMFPCVLPAEWIDPPECECKHTPYRFITRNLPLLIFTNPF
jgi:PPPDE putative peptidase domain